MFTDMKKWTQIRLDALRDAVSKREIIRREGLHGETLKKVLTHSQPPGYRMKEARSKPKIGPYLERIAQIIDEDKGYPKKQLQRLYLLVLDELRYVPFSKAGSKTKISLKIKN